ncbi:hypothetical protein OHT76_07405 [Streptomyces sp. NBC_00287]|uniref:hypothetical protein n=1 Tax=Streptomyces sp. NBC_00287 TaxID=2975702 RepID=UPI002E2A5B95|nr:hypothetical protein [Streptomyces sp. NBC_00287]
MGTAERREAPDDGGTAVRLTVRQGPQAPDRDIPADRGEVLTGAGEKAAAYAQVTGSDERSERDEGQEQALYRPLWVEEPARRRRMPDPVRTAAVRAVLIIAVTLIQAMVAFLCTLAGSWLAFPMVLSSVASTVVATWGAVDVWVTRQVWNQRNGVVSTPASTARALRRERRRARRQAKATGRAQERIPGRGGAGQLSHS